MAFSNTVLASTLQRREKGYSNIISSHIPYFHWFKKKKRYKKWDGGTPYQFNLEVALNTNDPSYAGYDTIPISPRDDVITAQATMKNYALPIAISGEEKAVNTGMQVFSLMEQKEKNALESMQQTMSDHLYLDGTGNGGKRITGLAAIIAASPTSGSLFNVDRATYTVHQNYVKDTNASALDISDGNPVMWNDMEDLRIKCGRLKIGGAQDRYPDLILCTETYFKLYQQVAHIMGFRIIDNEMADAGFDALKFHNTTIMHDEDCPADAGGDAQAYFINSAFMDLLYHPDWDFKVGEMQRMESQDAFSCYIIWRGENIARACRKLGVHEGVQAVQA